MMLKCVHNNGRTPLSWAAVDHAPQVVKLLLEKRAYSESKDGHMPLSLAALLLKSRPDPYAKDNHTRDLLLRTASTDNKPASKQSSAKEEVDQSPNVGTTKPVFYTFEPMRTKWSACRGLPFPPEPCMEMFHYLQIHRDPDSMEAPLEQELAIHEI